jgi:dehydrogenase/reductase SDR family protein 12
MGAEYSIVAFIQWRRAGFRTYGRSGFEEASTRWARSAIKPAPGRPHPNEMRDSLEGRHVVVTGANAGLGFCIAEELARKRATVHLVCRDAGRGEAARARIVESTGSQAVVLHTCDVSSQQSVHAFAEAYCRDVGQLYCLVNNAGCMPTTRQVSADSIEASLATMAGGTFLLTGLLLPALRASASAAGGGDARVVNVSSAGMYSMYVNPDDLNSEKRAYDGPRVYAIAKRVQCDLTRVWAEEVGVLFLRVGGW